MNIEAYDLDSLRKLVRELQAENRSDAQAPDEYDPDQASRIIPVSVDDDVAKRFYGMFLGRTDVFAKRGKNGGYFPQCENRWDAACCPKQRGEKHRDGH